MHTIKQSSYQIRISEKDKKEAFDVFNRLGIKPAQAIKMFFKKVVLSNGIPFEISNIPSQSTQKTLMNNKKSEYQKFEDVDALFDDLMK